MRLDPHEIAAIKAAARVTFGPGAAVRLFGSRRHDHRRGGDIDLLIEVEGDLPDYFAKSRFIDLIEKAVDYKKVDLLLTRRDAARLPFEKIAYRDGVIL